MIYLLYSYCWLGTLFKTAFIRGTIGLDKRSKSAHIKLAIGSLINFINQHNWLLATMLRYTGYVNRQKDCFTEIKVREDMYSNVD